MRRTLLLFVLSAVGLASLASGASAATSSATASCRDKVYNEWYADGKIATTYPLACYRAALAHLNGSADLTVYSSLGDDIRLALAAAVRRARQQSAPAEVGKGFGRTVAHAPVVTTSTTVPVESGVKHARHTSTPVRIHKPPPAGPRTTPGSPVAAPLSSPSSGPPVVLLVLGGVALLLIAAGGAGAGLRYTRRRRDS